MIVRRGQRPAKGSFGAGRKVAEVREGRALVRLPLLFLGAVFAASPVAAGAGEAGGRPGGFVATASAQDVRITYSVLGFAAVEDVVDGGGTVAQAQLDGGGNSRSFAALPYPGDLIISGPGLFAFATGQQLPGGYPFFVAAETPLRPEAKMDGPGGGYALLAQAAPHRSTGRGRLLLGDGQSGGGTDGEALTEVTGDGTVRSAATSVAEGLNLGGGALRIGAVRSSSVTTLAPGAGQPTSTSSMVVEGMSVAGTPVTIGPDGLSVAGSALPGGSALDGVEQALAQAGIQVQVVEAKPQDGGERARSLEIRTVATPPFPGFPPQQVVISLGGATTAINVGQSLPGVLPAVPPVEAGEPAPGATSDRQPEVAGQPAARPVTPVDAPAGRPALPIRSPGATALVSGAPAAVPGAAGAVAEVTTPEGVTPSLGGGSGAPVAETGQSQALQRVTLARGLRHPITALYLPFGVGAAVAFAGAFLWLTRGGSRA